MTEIEILWPDGLPADEVATDVEAGCSARGLTQTRRGTLGKYPGCIHWHYKSGQAVGVLEVTLWPHRHRLWLVVHKNRQADWIDEAVARLKPEIEAHLQKRSAVLKRSHNSATPRG